MVGVEESGDANHGIELEQGDGGAHIIEANSSILDAFDDSGKFPQDRVNSRRAGDFILAPRNEVQFIDVSPNARIQL